MLVGQRTQISNRYAALLASSGLRSVRVWSTSAALQKIWTQRHTRTCRLSRKTLLNHCLSTYWRSMPVLWIWIKRLRQVRSRIIVSSCCKPSQALPQSMRPLLSPRLAVHISLKAGVTLGTSLTAQAL